MRIALVNPPWSFQHSIYFGCREPHLPLEYGSAKVLLEAAGHEATIFDGHLFHLSMQEVAGQVRAYAPDMTVVTTAPSYLFWRCAPPELRVPQRLLHELNDICGLIVAVGPHLSTTPRATMRKLGVNVGILGECEEALVDIAGGRRNVAGTAVRQGDDIIVHGGPRATEFVRLPPLTWSAEWIACHHHHHHRFEAAPDGPGAEVEASRGCPYHCTFCAKENFRDRYRRRDLLNLLTEIDGLLAEGVAYIYFIDEIFLPNQPLLEALAQREVKFGIQTRIDLWKPDMIGLLGKAGCVSIEAGVESLTREGRDTLEKLCRLSTDQLAERLILAREHVPFVQANLIEMPGDDDGMVQRWRDNLRSHGVWANDPVPLFPYPGSPDYRKLWGMPDDRAWERAVDYYVERYGSFSEIQESRPRSLSELERAAA
ncbi:MAG: TIGR04295 family B12-binding domain-containing radical SAM protein [Alphaproteobacteria bacterium]|nr:TIGR04295 family B12-binding domain-containing radical SAM protein [Alphaproteobacteria bacterium]